MAVRVETMFPRHGEGCAACADPTRRSFGTVRVVLGPGVSWFLCEEHARQLRDGLSGHLARDPSRRTRDVG